MILPGPDRPAPLRGRGRRTRLLLSVFFLVHWGAVGLYLAPSTREGVERLPAWAQPVARTVFSPVVHHLWPLAGPYLDLTSTRQHWTLFAPDPADWIPNVEAVLYFAAEDAEGPGWQVDTVGLRGGDEAPYPHLLGHRVQRNVYQLGYDGEGSIRYRRLVARELCRSVADGRGRLPDGVALQARWRRIDIPWEPDSLDPPYEQRLGGYSCDPEESARRRRAPWPPYGLPAFASPSGPLVRGVVPAGDGEEGGNQPDAAPGRDGR